MQRQQDDVYDLWQINDLAQSLWTTSPAGLPANVWSLNIENRIDHDRAVFGELSYDLMPKKLTLTVGDRYFKSENFQVGEVGYGAFFGFAEPHFDADTRDTGNTPKATITYHVDDHRMVYATYSTGYRPGGINRRPTQSPYKADYLKNYELGWKTSWLENRLRFNGAVFQENWDKYQFSFQGTNGASEFANAGFARIRGMESDVAWAATDRFTVTGGITWIDPVITENYCGKVDANGNPITNCPSPKAPAGTQLPNVPKVKGNVTGRYVFQLADFAAYLQGTFVYQTSTWNDLRLKERGRLGGNPAYGVADFSAGIAKGDRTLELIVNNAFDRRGIASRMAGCSINSCAPIAVYAIPIEPRMVGIKFGESF